MKPTLPNLSGLRIAVLNPYLEGREKDCARNLYPRSHLWGADALARAGAQVEFIAPIAHSRIGCFLSRLSRLARGRLGNLDFDWAMVRKAQRFDLIYVPNGCFLLTQFLRALGLIRAPVILWTYLPPQYSPLWKLRNLQERYPFCSGIDGLLCLTRASAEGWQQRWPQKLVSHVDWGADTIMFPGCETDGEFFFACGRTNRDYSTLLAAAAAVQAPFVILASRGLIGETPVPPNVTFVEGPQNAGTDRGVSYLEMIWNYYAKAKAVVICRQDIADDTSGLTNLLEAIAMGRPVAITRTGALDIDVEKEGVGRFVEPKDVDGWVAILNQWVREPLQLAEMRSRALQLARGYYNHERHGMDVAKFVREVINSQRKPSQNLH